MQAIRGDLALADFTAKHDVHHRMIAGWKRQAFGAMAITFSGTDDAAKAAIKSKVSKLRAEIGRFVVKRDFLAQIFGP